MSVSLVGEKDVALLLFIPFYLLVMFNGLSVTVIPVSVTRVSESHLISFGAHADRTAK